MKLQAFKLVKVAAVFGLALLASAPGRAFTNNSAFPHPAAGGWYADSSIFYGTVNGVTSYWGWTLARYSGTGIFLKWDLEGTKFDNSVDVIDQSTGGGGTFSYKNMENYWNASTYKSAKSNVSKSDNTFLAEANVW